MKLLSTSKRQARRVILASILATSMAIAGCSGPNSDNDSKADEKQSLTDVMGRTVEIPAHPERLLFGGQRLLYTTALLDKENPLENIAAWPDDLEQNDMATYEKYKEKFPDIANITKTGEVWDGSMSLEQALQARPDVFVVSAGSFDAAKEAGLIEGLEKAGVPTVTVDYFIDPAKNTVPSVTLMGKLTGHTDEAKKYTDFYQEKLDRVHKRLKDSNQPPTDTFLWRAPGYFDCCSTFNKSNLATLVNEAGGNNLGDSMIDTKQGQVSPESLAGKNPDVIVATGADWSPDRSPVKGKKYVALGYDEPADKAKQQLSEVVSSQAAVSQVDAVKNHRTYAMWHHFYDSPYNVIAIEWMAKAMHPELFGDLDPDADMKTLHEQFLPVKYSGTFWTQLS